MDFTKLKENLTNNGFKVSVFDNKEAATEYLNKTINGFTVGIGGSMTIKAMDLYNILGKHNQVFWHWEEKEGFSKDEIYREAQKADVYFSSVNGVAETGEMINIDGSGNRVSAIQYGHKKVYLIIGNNKVAADYDKALFRARNIAAPLNAQRLKKNTPCAINGTKCFDCQSPDRICRGLSVLWKKPSNCEYEVVLINEPLGY